jgi:hypothetical protein
MADWDALCTETVTIEPYAGQDAYTKPTFGEAVTVRCRVSGRARLVVTANGEERTSNVQVYLVSSPGVSNKDRITLPAGWTPAQPPILAIGRSPDETGAIYETIYA